MDRKKILLVRTDRLGDVILTLPMLPMLKRSFPNAEISMLVSAYTSDLLRNNGYLDEVLLYDDSHNLIPFRRLLRELRSRNFDVVILVHPTLRLALLVSLARIPTRIGTGYRWYSFLFSRKVYEHRKDAKRHEAEYNLNLLSVLGCRWSYPLEFPIEIPSEDIENIREVCEAASIVGEKPLIVLHPGSGGSARDWRPTNFGALATRCVEELGADVVFTGGKGEEQIVQECLSEVRKVVVNLVNKLALMELAALIRRADLFVSNSTGPLHIAAAIGTPVIGLYPPIVQCSPERWGPYTEKKKVFVPDRNLCSRCQGGECEASECMDQISVEEVFTAARELVELRAKRGRHEAHVQKASL